MLLSWLIGTQCCSGLSLEVSGMPYCCLTCRESLCVKFSGAMLSLLALRIINTVLTFLAYTCVHALLKIIAEARSSRLYDVVVPFSPLCVPCNPWILIQPLLLPLLDPCLSYLQILAFVCSSESIASSMYSPMCCFFSFPSDVVSLTRVGIMATCLSKN